MVKSQQMPAKIRVLFLCTGNSCRSQMAEGLTRHLIGSQVEACSAGTLPQALNPNAVLVMQEIGIDISNQKSKSVNDLRHENFDYVITVCAEANAQCPIWPGRGIVIHQGFDDPPQLAQSAPTLEEILPHYRRVRDAIKEYVLSLPDNLRSQQEAR